MTYVAAAEMRRFSLLCSRAAFLLSWQLRPGTDVIMQEIATSGTSHPKFILASNPPLRSLLQTPSAPFGLDALAESAALSGKSRAYTRRASHNSLSQNAARGVS